MNTNSCTKKLKFSVLSCLALSCASGSAASLAFVPGIPTTDLLQTSSGSEAPQGTANSQAAFGFNATNNGAEDTQGGTRGRGQSFLFSTGSGSAYDISSFSVSLNGSAGNAVRPDGDLTVSIFEWDNATDPDDFTTWTVDTGASGGTQLFSQALPVAAGTALNNGQLAEITFTSGELTLQDGVAYGIFFRYTLDDVTGLTSDVTIAFDTRQDAGAAGALLNTNTSASFATADNGESTGRDLNFFITGTAIPEPSSLALLALGGLAFARRRR